MSTTAQNPKLPSQDLDALVVGAGFGGLLQLHRLREAGFSVKAFEAGSKMGGTWHWNCYPGARVDSEFSIYQYSMEELWRDWNWKERFPGRDELVAYFEHVDQKYDLSRDIIFDTRVTAARYDTELNRWIVTTQDGTVVRTHFLILCTGFASKPLYPTYKGMDTFKGVMHHTSRWPQEGVDLKGKRIGVIGTGASGVQVIQECGPDAAHLTVFQRTPNLTIPMRQHKIDTKLQDEMKEELYPYIFRRREQTSGGFNMDFVYKSIMDVTPEHRYLFLEDLWAKGGFHYWLGNFADVLMDDRSNEFVYSFWQKKVKRRLNDPEMQRKLAPVVAPHPFGTKRPCLEQRYYEVFNLPHVDLIAIKENPIAEFTPKGIRTQDGVEHEFDVIVLATGFDAVTGSFVEMDITGANGELVRDKWSRGLSTYLGMTITNYPNLFYLFGPHGPTAFCNGPSCVEFQSGWITDCIKHMRANNLTKMEPNQEAEDAFVKGVNDVFAMTLWSKVESWYTGSNVPGKRFETLNYLAGVPIYISTCKECAENGYKGITFSGPGAKPTAVDSVSESANLVGGLGTATEQSVVQA